MLHLFYILILLYLHMFNLQAVNILSRLFMLEQSIVANTACKALLLKLTNAPLLSSPITDFEIRESVLKVNRHYRIAQYPQTFSGH